MSEERLAPCPFCGAGTFRVEDTKLWTGMRNEIISARVTHWCPRKEGQPQSILQLAGKSRDDAIANWNTRAGASA